MRWLRFGNGSQVESEFSAKAPCREGGRSTFEVVTISFPLSCYYLAKVHGGTKAGFNKQCFQGNTYNFMFNIYATVSNYARIANLLWFSILYP